GDDEPDDPDRDVQEEDRLPAEVLDHPAAERRSKREREAGDAGPQADRAGALLRRERDREDRERARQQQRRADALRGAEADQHAARTREPARERGEREDREPREEHALTSVAVSQDAAGQQQG